MAEEGVHNSDNSEITEDRQKEIVWLPPEADEEWVLFRRLLDEIELMYEFARDRGIEPPLAAIEAIPKLLALSKPYASKISRSPQPKDQPIASEPKPIR